MSNGGINLSFQSHSCSLSLIFNLIINCICNLYFSKQSISLCSQAHINLCQCLGEIISTFYSNNLNLITFIVFIIPIRDNCRIVTIRDTNMVCSINSHYYRVFILTTCFKSHISLRVGYNSGIIAILYDELASTYAVQVYLIVYGKKCILLLCICSINSNILLICRTQGCFLRGIVP